MFSLDTSHSITSFINLVLAYLLAIGPVGFFNAWIAKRVGDDTAAQEGLLTIDPFAHIDPIGFFCLLLFRIGWHKSIPINFDLITPPFRNLKVGLALFGETFFCLVLSFVGLIVFFLLSLISGEKLCAIPNDDTSSLFIAIKSVIITFVGLVLFFAVARFLYGLLLLMIMMLSKNYQSYAQLLSEMSFIILFIMIVLFAGQLQTLCFYGLLWLCTLISNAIGLFF